MRSLEHFPMDLRGGLLRWFSDNEVGPGDIWGEFAQRLGYGTVEDYVRGCDQRHGPGASVACRARMDQYWATVSQQVPSAIGASREALQRTRLNKAHILALHAMPDGDFVHALEGACELVVNRMAYRDIGMVGYDYAGVVTEHVNGVLQRRAVPFRLSDDLKMEFRGDEALHDVAVAPALAALIDPRLAGARSEFQDALAKLRRAQPKDLEDAIEESRKAVESTMKVLLVAHGGLLPQGKQTTQPLHRALVDAGILEPQTDDLVRAAARLANAGASHGSGHAVREVPTDLAAAAVAAAAVAIAFLAGRMP